MLKLFLERNLFFVYSPSSIFPGWVFFSVSAKETWTKVTLAVTHLSWVYPWWLVFKTETKNPLPWTICSNFSKKKKKNSSWKLDGNKLFAGMMECSNLKFFGLVSNTTQIQCWNYHCEKKHNTRLAIYFCMIKLIFTMDLIC